MKLFFDANNTKVFDDVLDPEDFSSLFDTFNYQPYVFRESQGEWNKVWTLTNGQILMGRQVMWAFGEEPNLAEGYKTFLPYIKQVNSMIRNSGLFNLEEVSMISMTPYCWPPGTGLSWHNDSNYLGAVTFYAHREWNPEWGGEFLTCEANEYIQENKENLTWKIFDNKELMDLLMEGASGNYFYPKPNRAIVNKGGQHGILHKVNQSTMNSSPRLTLQCFIHSTAAFPRDAKTPPVYF